MPNSDFASLAGDVPAASKRELNMRRRREGISQAAAEIIVDEGIDNLTLSKVAEKADLTVPTIHNLFGKKQDIYAHLTVQVSKRMMKHIHSFASATLFEDMEAGVNCLVETVRENEVEFKAGFLVGERTNKFGVVGDPYKTASKTTPNKFLHLIENGDLQGKISPHLLAKLVNDQFRVQRIDWMRGQITLDEFRRELLWGFYVALLADATPKFRKKLHARIESLED